MALKGVKNFSFIYDVVYNHLYAHAAAGINSDIIFYTRNPKAKDTMTITHKCH